MCLETNSRTVLREIADPRSNQIPEQIEISRDQIGPNFRPNQIQSEPILDASQNEITKLVQ